MTGAIELAATYGLKVIAKNPKLVERGAAAYVAHPNVHGIIVENRDGHRGIEFPEVHEVELPKAN